MAPKVTIRKYSNRRLYDTEASRYVNFSDIVEIIRSGATVSIVESSTGEDLTRATLSQILFEEDRKEALLPEALMVWLLRLGPRQASGLLESFISYMDDLFEAGQVQTTLAEELLGQVPEGPWSAALAPLKATARLASSSLSLLRPQGKARPDPAEELRELRRRLAELERRLGESDEGL